MIQQQLRKVGNSYVVTIPKEEVERLNISEGQLLGLEITPLEIKPVLRPELLAALEETWEEDLEAYHYLAQR